MQRLTLKALPLWILRNCFIVCNFTISSAAFLKCLFWPLYSHSYPYYSTKYQISETCTLHQNEKKNSSNRWIAKTIKCQPYLALLRYIAAFNFLRPFFTVCNVTISSADIKARSGQAFGEIKSHISQRGQIVYETATMLTLIHIPYFSTRVKTREIVAASIFCAFFSVCNVTMYSAGIKARSGQAFCKIKPLTTVTSVSAYFSLRAHARFSRFLSSNHSC